MSFIGTDVKGGAAPLPPKSLSLGPQAPSPGQGVALAAEPRDRFEPGASGPGLGSRPQQPPSRIPNLPEFRRYEEARSQLEAARLGQHPEVSRAFADIDQGVERNLLPARQALDLEVARLDRSRQTVEQTYAEAEKKFAQGWEPERRRHLEAVKSEVEAATALDGPPTRGQQFRPTSALNRIAQIEKVQDQPLYAGNKEAFQRETEKLKSELRQHGISYPSKSELEKYRADPKKFKGQQKNALEYLVRAQDNVESGRFPATKKRQQEWLAQRGQDKERGLASIEGQLGDARKAYQAAESQLAGPAGEQKKAVQAKVVQRLEGQLEQARCPKVDDLSPLIKDSPAVKGLWNWGREVKINGNGMEITDGGKRKVNVSHQGPDKLIVEGNDPNLKARSEYQRNPDGSWAEKTDTSSYYTHKPGAPELYQTRSLERDGQGGEKVREINFSSWDGRQRESNVHSQNGVVSYKQEIRRDKDGKPEFESVFREGAGKEGGVHREETESHAGKRTSTKTTDITTTDGVLTTKVDHQRTQSHTESTQRDFRDGSQRMESKTTEGSTTTTSVSTRDSAGKTSEYLKSTGPGYQSGSTFQREIDKVDGKAVKTVTTETVPITPDTDVPGLGWIGSHNPQDLVERLGDESKIRSEKITQTVSQDGKTHKTETIRRSSADGWTELMETRSNGGGASVWTLNEKKKDGRVDSQVFFQGSDDTILTKNTEENGWKVTTTTTRLDDLQAAKTSDVPKSGHSVAKVKEGATMSEVDRMLDGTKPPLSAVRKSENYKYFQELAAGGKLKVVANQTDDKYANGTSKAQAQFVVQSEAGDRLIISCDPKTGEPIMRRDNTAKPELGFAETFVKGGDILEVGADGSMALQAKDGSVSTLASDARQWIKLHADAITAGSKGARAVARGTQSVLESDMLGGSTMAQKMASRSASIADRLKEGPAHAKFGATVGGASGALSGIATISSIINGDTEGALRAGSNLGDDIASVTKSMEELAKARGVALGAKGQWLARAGKMTGVIGAVGGAGLGIYDITQGKVVSGTLALAGTGGSALALFGSASWAGPVGWGVASVATLGSLAWDYNEGTRIADYQL